MFKRAGLLQAVAVLALIAFVQALVLPQMAEAQTTDCPFDKENPSIDNARYNFKITNYDCAELELQALLAKPDLDLQDKADAHVLLASVYYAKIRNDEEKRNVVVEELVSAFTAFRNWRGDLDISSPEFLAMMEEAQALVDQKADAEGEAAGQIEGQEDEAPVTVIKPEKKKKGAWYKQWWAIGLGVGLVATTVVLVAGGGGDEPVPEDNTLPGFPDPPAKR